MNELVKCPFCGKEIESDSWYCDQCGNELMVCPNGHGFRKGKMCGMCGKPLVSAVVFMQAQSNNNINQDNVNAQTIKDSSGNIYQKEAELKEKSISVPKQLYSERLNAYMNLKDGAVIGRREGDFVPIFSNQGYVSGRHAMMKMNNQNEWTIEDLDSTNGTYINGCKIEPNRPHVIRIGDTVSFYDISFIVQ